MVEEAACDPPAVRAVVPGIDDVLVPEFVDLGVGGSVAFRLCRFEIEESPVALFHGRRTLWSPAEIIDELRHHRRLAHRGGILRRGNR
jgi:hypothetical protein